MRLANQSDTREVRFLKEPPCVYITRAAHRKIQAILRLVKVEVSFLGTVERLSQYTFLVTEIFLFRQTCSWKETTLHADGQLDLMMRLRSEGAAGKAKVEALRFWGHSHGELPIFVSKKDESTFDRLMKDGRPFQIMAIFNRRGLSLCEVFLADEGMIISDVPIVVKERPLTARELSLTKAEIDKLVTEVPALPKPSTRKKGPNHVES